MTARAGERRGSRLPADWRDINAAIPLSSLILDHTCTLRPTT